MTERYFIPEPITGQSLKLSGPEAHHMLKVMRTRLGDQVILFDGGGAEFVAELVAEGRDLAQLDIRERREVDREPPVAVTLGVALPKGDRQKWLVEKATELGVARLVAIRTARGAAHIGGAAIERLLRSVIEASKQCGRNRLMQLDEPIEAADFFAQALNTTDSPPPFCVLADFAGPPLAALAPRLVSVKAVHLAVGPEGGFTAEEIEQARANGWQSASLGERTLRIETAALAMASVVISLAT